MTPHRFCYVISSARGFLSDLWDGAATWSPAPHDAMLHGMAWLDLAVARAKRMHCQKAMPELLLHLTLIEFVKDGDAWTPVAQQEVKV